MTRPTRQRLSLIAREGLVRFVEESNGQFVTDYVVDGLTDKGRQALEQVDDDETGEIRVFVSHAKVDQQLVTAFVELLIAGTDIDRGQIRASSVNGTRYKAGVSIVDAVRADVLYATAFVAVLTPASVKSTWVLFEIGARWGSGRPLVPLLGGGLTANSLKGPLSVLNALVASETSQLHQALDELAAAVDAKRHSPARYSTQLETVRTLSLPKAR